MTRIDHTTNAQFVAESCQGNKDSKPTWVVFMAKVRNNTGQSQFWMWIQIIFYSHFYKGYHIRKDKRCRVDPSVPVPKSTKLDHNKRSTISTQLKAVVPIESGASYKGETYVQETEATRCDYRGTLEFWSINGYALSEAFPSLERGVENEDTRLSFDTEVKFYKRPTKYKTILLIAGSEKNNN